MVTVPAVLIVDDESLDRRSIKQFLSPDYTTLEAGSAAEARQLLKSENVDCVVLDYNLPDVTSLELLETFVGAEIPVVMLTGEGDEALAVDCMKRGAEDYLVKFDIDPGSCQRAIANALERSRLRSEVRQERLRLDSLRDAIRDDVHAALEKSRELCDRLEARFPQPPEELVALRAELERATAFITEVAPTPLATEGAVTPER